MSPDEYCQQKAAQSGSSFYYSFLFLPAERRRAITALYAFCREVDDVADDVSDAGVARAMMLEGAPLARALPGRLGLEIRATVAGGLAILDRIEAARGDVFRRRPVLRSLDWPVLLARAL